MISLSEQNSGRADVSKLFGFGGNHLELHCLESSPDQEGIILLQWSIGILEIRNEVGLCNVSSNTLNCILKGQNVNFSEVGDISCCLDLDHVS